ncbi:hypothetical protein BN946_scf185044.g30 [Trametes cinnabarina]|uniref:Uncharacterized protein n=1 Tax=Pycnoporus cinnabarinus TaxID=5643 RepID=A0A060S183_PYCCI|nr:hypothetical protein BN946_scf185044.g30 [Trametes cinnabarina]
MRIELQISVRLELQAPKLPWSSSELMPPLLLDPGARIVQARSRAHLKLPLTELMALAHGAHESGAPIVQPRQLTLLKFGAPSDPELPPKKSELPRSPIM